MPRVTNIPKPFHKGCNPRPCEKLAKDIKKMRRRGLIKPYKSKKTGRLEYTEFRRIDGLGWEKVKFKKTIGGPSFKFKRCNIYAYRDKASGKKTEATCVDYVPINIPKVTVECYEKYAKFFKKIKGEKRGRPSQSYKILALLACNKTIKACCHDSRDCFCNNRTSIRQR